MGDPLAFAAVGCEGVFRGWTGFVFHDDDGFLCFYRLPGRNGVEELQAIARLLGELGGKSCRHAVVYGHVVLQHRTGSVDARGMPAVNSIRLSTANAAYMIGVMYFDSSSTAGFYSPITG